LERLRTLWREVLKMKMNVRFYCIIDLELYPYSVDMIHETFPVTNQYVSVPPDLGHLNCAAYIAGVASGILDGANFVR